MNRDKNTPSVSMTTAYGTIYADVMKGMIRFAQTDHRGIRNEIQVPNDKLDELKRVVNAMIATVGQTNIRPITKGKSIEEYRASDGANAYKKWTPEEETKLKQLYDSGMSIPDVAKTMERKDSAIESRLIKLGIKK